MTTIELIRQEIKKRILHFNKEAEKYQALNNGYSQNCYGARDALRDLKNFLDTLPDEPVTDCHELTEAAIDFADYARKALYSKDYAISSIADYDHGCIDGFKAGAKWGAEHLRDATKKISEDLEEAARECSKTIYNKPLSGNPQEGYIVYDPDKYDAFKAGAEWMKAKMMDEAYEEEVQEVYRDDGGIHCCVSVGTDYKPGTIVYVITIPKEEEQ